MDYLQYYNVDRVGNREEELGFKPYYKWITFNTTPILNVSENIFKF